MYIKQLQGYMVWHGSRLSLRQDRSSLHHEKSTPVARRGRKARNLEGSSRDRPVAEGRKNGAMHAPIGEPNSGQRGVLPPQAEEGMPC